MNIGNLPPLNGKSHIIAIGIEGSANKIGVGIIRYTANEYEIISNPRKTYITTAGQGFLPRETAWHHQTHINALVRAALVEAKIQPDEIDCICYTKGPGMGGPLRSCAVCARVLSMLWNKPLIAVNHCIAHIESCSVDNHACTVDIKREQNNLISRLSFPSDVAIQSSFMCLVVIRKS
jgi:tRNA A37 threonylcarbamoyltransferase TsaD